MQDPEDFLNRLRPGQRVVLDEVQRLENPSELLKIAADHYPRIKILATGSSTLGASRKFKDTLTGRKYTVWLTPMITEDLYSFGNQDLHHRLLRGGLPPFFLSDILQEPAYQDWIDDYWSKDIQELFQLERRSSFKKFFELLMAQSGGLFEATRFAGRCEVSRQTIMNYLAILEDTFVIRVLRPFNTHKPTEIVSAPKVYGFDTGFVCSHKGWPSLRREDMGLLWEHYVLNELQAHRQSSRLHYWRDKRNHEVDFILADWGRPPLAIECKWSSADLDPSNFQQFRKHYPEGKNFVVTSDVTLPHKKSFKDLAVEFVNLEQLINTITLQAPGAPSIP